jgi:hypothetical protein
MSITTKVLRARIAETLSEKELTLAIELAESDPRVRDLKLSIAKELLLAGRVSQQPVGVKVRAPRRSSGAVIRRTKAQMDHLRQALEPLKQGKRVVIEKVNRQQFTANESYARAALSPTRLKITQGKRHSRHVFDQVFEVNGI